MTRKLVKTNIAGETKFANICPNWPGMPYILKISQRLHCTIAQKSSAIMINRVVLFFRIGLYMMQKILDRGLCKKFEM